MKPVLLQQLNRRVTDVLLAFDSQDFIAILKVEVPPAISHQLVQQWPQRRDCLVIVDSGNEYPNSFAGLDRNGSAERDTIGLHRNADEWAGVIFSGWQIS